MLRFLIALLLDFYGGLCSNKLYEKDYDCSRKDGYRGVQRLYRRI